MAFGKGKTRDLERTRRKILVHAEKLFAARGYAGTSVTMIADAAGVHKRMLHYCFTSKRQLFKAVYLNAGSRFPQIVKDMPTDFTSLLIYWHQVFYRFPITARLMAWEGLEPEHKGNITTQRHQMYDLVKATLRQAQNEGKLPADMDPGQIHSVIIALTAFPYTFTQHYYLMTGARVREKKFYRDREDFLKLLGERLGRELTGGLNSMEDSHAMRDSVNGSLSE